MKPKTCDEIREQAFRDGLDSPAAAEWRAHCRSCPDCRTELFILENLERQASEERQHLGRDEVAKLLATARSYQRERTPNPVLVWGLRAACVTALLLLGAGLFPGELGGSVRQRVQAWLRGTDEATTTAAASRPEIENPTLPTEPVPAAVTAPTEELDRQLRGLRQGMERRRRSLERLLERDFGPFNPEGAWHVALRTAPENA